MKSTELSAGLLNFIQKSPTPFHAVQTMVTMLEEDGFERLNESQAWQMKSQPIQGKYYVTRNDSSLIAFTLHQPVVDNGIRMVGAHTDSPCLKVKPNPEIFNQEYMQLGVEVYGGVLLNPWFDRDLSLAGRVSYLDEKQQLQHALINFNKAIAIIPSLAIHLDREANDMHSINKQTSITPILMNAAADAETPVSFAKLLIEQLNAQHSAANAVEILDYELSFYDVQPPALVGFHDDFIAAARLDNLLSCYVGLKALVDSSGNQNTLLVCTDHEEVGSASTSGAQGTFLKSVLSRLCANDEDMARFMAASLMISADNAHAIHPNFADKHDANHGPIINNGPVIKTNANQRYATNSESSALFKQCCKQAEVPVQSFVVRSDLGCGSTIGPIAANTLGVRTVDIGVPTFAMHSIRELAGKQDVEYLYQALVAYYASNANASEPG